MKYLRKIREWVAQKQTQSSLVVTGHKPDYPLEEAGDGRVQRNALDALNDQLHAVVDQNADGINRSAIQIRRDSDLLMTLGITDAFVAKAGTLAQMALEMANSGRGVDLNEERHQVSVSDRAHCVASAMALVTQAESLLSAAKKKNQKNIDDALHRQARILEEMRSSSYSKQIAQLTE